MVSLGIILNASRVRQEDPLSPLLFVLAADLLQSVVNDMCSKGLISLPIPTQSQDFPIDMLDTFTASTGLSVNFAKSLMVPMNLAPEEANRIANLLGCKIVSMPFTYLGLPMGTRRPRIQDIMAIVDRIERRLSATSCFLNQESRLRFLQSVLQSMPIYFLCTLSTPRVF